MRILFFLLTFFFFAMASAYAKGDMVVCTAEYAPVCGAPKVEPFCQDGICAMPMVVPKTYSNTCMMRADKAEMIHAGACSDGSIVGGDTDKYGCKASAGYSWNADTKKCTRSWEPTSDDIVGGDVDAHGCKGSAGYRWNPIVKKCIRPWESRVRILTVGPNYRSCIGVAPMQCLQVRSGKMGWQNFYNSISGFDYTPGYTYRLQVLETKVENPPADGSDRTYELIRILSQKGTPVSKNSHIQGTWKLVSFNGKDVVGNYTAMIESDKVSFRFCNTVFGSYSLSGNVFVAPVLASTKMYCQGESMSLEDAFDLNDATYTLISTKSLPPIHTLTLKTKTGNTYTYTR